MFTAPRTVRHYYGTTTYPAALHIPDDLTGTVGVWASHDAWEDGARAVEIYDGPRTYVPPVKPAPTTRADTSPSVSETYRL